MTNKDSLYKLTFVVLFCLIYEKAGCIIKYLFGLSCPGCGMTRAFLALAHLDIVKAFEYHPLFWCVPLAAFYYLKNKTLRKRTIVILLFLFLGVYLIRLLNPNCTIVTYCKEEGAIYQLLHRIMY